jgi:hypothetical protein
MLAPDDVARADRDADKPPDPSAPASAGLGRASRDAVTGGDAPSAGVVAPDARSLSPTPAWSASSWPADRAAARTALNSGSIPGPYRDLVREYFDISSDN